MTSATDQSAAAFAMIDELGQVAGCDHTVTVDQRGAREGAMQLLGPGDGSPTRDGVPKGDPHADVQQRGPR